MTRPAKRLALFSALIVTLLGGVGLGWVQSFVPGDSLEPSGAVSQAPAAQPSSGDEALPILTAQDAISRVLVELPSAVGVVTSAARLMTYTTAAQWLHGAEFSDVITGPVWVVGIQTTDLYTHDMFGVGDIAALLADSEVPTTTLAAFSNTNTLNDGVFYVWDAAYGSLVARGALMPEATTSYSSLHSLSHHPIAIPTPVE